jgi:N-acetylglucosaminyldiphosphoundecaprenol N-acetyl-beta-D-mannosaminyltransferase
VPSAEQVPTGTRHEYPVAQPVPRYELLDTYVDAYTLETFLQDVQAAVASGSRLLIANHNINSLTLMRRDARFRSFFDSVDRIFIDGTGVLLLARMFGARLRHANRLAVLDWIWPFCARAESEGWRVAHLGGTGETLQAAREALLERHPELSLTTIDGFFDALDGAANAAVLERLVEARPDVLLIGMGMPRQERWLEDNRAALPVCVTVTVGGILSFIGAERPTPPRWIGRYGLEWAYRVATEPRRLWRRYLVEPFALVPVVIRALIRERGRRRRQG